VVDAKSLADVVDIEDLELKKTEDQRTFRNMNIQAYIDEKIAALPEGSHGAAVAYWSPEFGFRTAIVGKMPIKVGDRTELRWSVAATKPRKAPWSPEAAVSVVW
jgi:hypothetical protein